MSFYSFYSDESGDYTVDPENKKIKEHPRFYRATFMIKDDDYNSLTNTYKTAKQLFGLPVDKEFKYSYLFPIKLLQNGKFDKEKLLHDTPKIEPFINVPYENLINFVEICLGSLNRLQSEVFIIVTDNKKLTNCTSERLYEMHMEDLVNRLCFAILNNRGDLGTLFFDKDENIEGILSTAYNKVIRENRFDLPFEKLRESLSFADSRHSIGIKVADYVTGCSAGFVKSIFNNGYKESRRMFMDYIFPNLHRKGMTLSGYGIMEVPDYDSIEEKIVSVINKESGGEYVEFLDTELNYQ